MKHDAHEFLVHAVAAWRAMRILGYIDPGAGSYGYQLVIAGVTGVLFFFSSIKRKFMSLFNKAKPVTGLNNTPSLQGSPVPRLQQPECCQTKLKSDE